MNPTMVFLREICLATWFGGLVVIDLIETPIRLRTPEVTRQQATAIGGRVFTSFGWFQVFIGVISLMASICISSARITSPVISIAVMLIISLFQAFFIAPKMLALRTQLYAPGSDPKIKPPGFAAVHSTYMLADLIKAIIALLLLFSLSCAHCQVV